MISPIGFDDTPSTAAHREQVLQLLDAYISFIQQNLGKNLKPEALMAFAQVEQSLSELRQQVATAEPQRLSEAQDAVAAMICKMLGHIAEITGDQTFKTMVAAYERQHDLMELTPRPERSVTPTFH